MFKAPYRLEKNRWRTRVRFESRPEGLGKSSLDSATRARPARPMWSRPQDEHDDVGAIERTSVHRQSARGHASSRARDAARDDTFQNTNEDVGSTAERPDSPIDSIDGYDCFEVDRDIGMLKDTNAEEATWEPLSSIYMDAPVVVKRYLKGVPSKEAKALKNALKMI